MASPYSVEQTITVFVDHEHLRALKDKLDRADARCVIVGYGEYAKHLVNWHPDKVAAIYDPRPVFRGVRFRGIPVVDCPKLLDSVNLVLAAEYEFLYDYLPSVIDLYPGCPSVIPPRMNYKKTSEINVFEQEQLYKTLSLHERDAPPSMMGKEKINFLLELLRFGLTKEGVVVEMGSWQGGSTWYMAKVLALLGETRALFAMDLFEDHVMDPTATMCTDEIRARLSVYKHVQMVQGLVDDRDCLEKLGGQPICFAHIDLGPLPVALDHIWRHLSPGAPLLLDNYGHVRAPPWDFDRYIEAKGSRIIRLPWSEQGLVFKSC